MDEFFDYASYSQSPSSATSSLQSIHTSSDQFAVPNTYALPQTSPYTAKRRPSRQSVHFATTDTDESAPRARRVAISHSLTVTSRHSEAPHSLDTLRGAVSSTSAQPSYYHTPPARSYLPLPSLADMPTPSQQEVEQYIQTLRTHRVNTLVELRRIEKILVGASSTTYIDVSQPMTAAWTYYVNSHALLTELRAVTRNYPFSAECLEEAKCRVYQDPESNRSWNFCWLVLMKMQTDHLIPFYAHAQASQPVMWGGQTPTQPAIKKLATAFTAEWNWALSQMLRHWSQPPRR